MTISLRVTEDKRARYKKFAAAIKCRRPKAEECISYQAASISSEWKIPCRLWGRANHCAFYPGSAVRALKNELKGYDTSKGTLRFPADKPLPATLVRKLVKLRMETKM